MAIPNIVPRGNDDGETLGTASKAWSNVYAKDVTVNGSSLTSTLSSKADASTVTTLSNTVSSQQEQIATLDSQMAGTADSGLKTEIANKIKKVVMTVDINASNAEVLSGWYYGLKMFSDIPNFPDEDKIYCIVPLLAFSDYLSKAMATLMVDIDTKRLVVHSYGNREYTCSIAVLYHD